METLLFQVVLFFTAAMAGWICSSSKGLLQGFATFLLLEVAYLNMFYGSLWVAVPCLIVGAGLVLRCPYPGDAKVARVESGN